MVEDEEFVLFYVKQAEKMRGNENTTMYINLRHLFEFDRSYELTDLVINEFNR